MPRSGPLPWRARKIREWVTLDLIASYTFNLPPPASAAVPGLVKDGAKSVDVKDRKQKNVVPVSTAEHNRCWWRGWLNNTTISLGMQNVFDQDPPFVPFAVNNYDESLANVKGRFWYAPAKKEILTELKQLTLVFQSRTMLRRALRSQTFRESRCFAEAFNEGC